MRHFRKCPSRALPLLILIPALAVADSFDIAITVADMPVHGPLPRGMSWLGITETHLKVFKANGVPEAFGFVNAGKIANTADGEAVLDAWRAAGTSASASTTGPIRMLTRAAWPGRIARRSRP